MTALESRVPNSHLLLRGRAAGPEEGNMVRQLQLVIAAALLIGAGTLTAAAETPSEAGHYVYCTFRPQVPSCAALYRQAMIDSDPDAVSVR
ncbi:MAG: hypothetical protein ACREFW_09415, partial [Rhizomicrobium sp.]